MQSRVQVYVDESGNKSSILMPYDDWTKLNTRIKRLENKLKVFSDIRDGIQEVNRSRQTGKKLRSLSEFINESRG